MGDADDEPSIGTKVQLLRNARNFRGAHVMANLKQSTLRKLALGMELFQVADGEQIVRMGEAGDAMFIIERGACIVEFNNGIKGALMRAGTSFGELALFVDGPRTATVAAAGPVRLLRMDKSVVGSVIQNAVGEPSELKRRQGLLSTVPIFNRLGKEELLQLGILMEEVVWNEDEIIMQEGKPGDCMYVLEEGNPKVYIMQRGGDQGLVATLEPGQYFGELAIVDAPASWRTATVKTVGITRCLRLRQKDVHRLFTSTKLQELIVASRGVYDKRQQLRASELVKAPIVKLWQLMVAESNRISQIEVGGQTCVARWQRVRRSTCGGAVTRAGYTSMHLRISKAVTNAFTLEEAKRVAYNDWAEDITAYSGDSKVNIWLEAIKNQLRKESRVGVMKTGWKLLFDRYDADGAGTIGVKEFCDAVRQDMQISDKEIADADLRLLFEAADRDNSEELDASEFAAWMVEPHSQADEEKYGKKIEEQKAIVQAASKASVTRLGWAQLFARYDTDGGGELDFREFTAIVRTDPLMVSVPTEDLRELFNAVDANSSAAIDVEEFIEFCCSDPLASDMTFDIFAESMFQLAQLWVSKADEHMYATFLWAIFGAITSPNGNLKDIDSSDGKNYRLKDMDGIACLANANGWLDIDGVQTNNVFGDGKPDPTFVDSSDQAGLDDADHTDKCQDSSTAEKIYQTGRTTSLGSVGHTSDRSQNRSAARKMKQVARTTGLNDVDHTNDATQIGLVAGKTNQTRQKVHITQRTRLAGRSRRGKHVPEHAWNPLWRLDETFERHDEALSKKFGMRVNQYHKDGVHEHYSVQFLELVGDEQLSSSASWFPTSGSKQLSRLHRGDTRRRRRRSTQPPPTLSTACRSMWVEGPNSSIVERVRLRASDISKHTLKTRDLGTRPSSAPAKSTRNTQARSQLRAKLTGRPQSATVFSHRQSC